VSRDFSMYDFQPIEPAEIQAIYESGFKGAIGDRHQSMLASAASDDFYAVHPGARGAGSGRLLLPYLMAMTYDDGFGRSEAQTTGDCVSHGARWGGMIHYCADVYLGQTAYKGRFATENIYGYRGHGGQGANCGRLSLYTSPSGPGGFLVRDRYSSGSSSVDLSTYRSSIGHNWGRPGTPAWLNQIAAQNKAMRVYRCTSMQMAIDALALGYGLNVCSGFGFSNQRNADGIAEQRGSWAHAMAWVGVDATNPNNPLFLVQNSWGVWNRGPKKYDQPDGSFFIRPSVAQRMLSGAYIIGSVRGYDRKIDYSMDLDRVERLSDAVKSYRSRTTVRGVDLRSPGTVAN
jgi:hypothetical protein